MKDVIIFKDKNGIGVVIPVGANKIEQLINAVPSGAEYIVAKRRSLPKDRYFRDAWDIVDGKLVVDIDAAKEIQRDHWRKLREPIIKRLDLQFMKALESGDEKLISEVTAKKNALRDVTNTPLPNDLKKIKATIPSILTQ